jgi:uncharacterized protein (TIGR00290 family)
MSGQVILAWSGGKDSTLALAALHAEGTRVAALLTTVTAGYDRVSVHGVRRSLLAAQARALGVPLREATIEIRASNESYERAWGDALASLAVEHSDARDVAYGDLFLADLRAYRERQLAAIGRGARFPLWQRDTASLARTFIADGYRAILVCVDTHALPADFAGRDFDESLLHDLPAGVDPCGENGEFHTFVTDGLIFDQPLDVVRGERVLREERFAYCDLTERVPRRETRQTRVRGDTG